MSIPRRPGMSVRLKLTLSYAAVIVVTGILLLAVVWVFLLRYVPDGVWMHQVQAEPAQEELLAETRLAPLGVSSLFGDLACLLLADLTWRVRGIGHSPTFLRA